MRLCRGSVNGHGATPVNLLREQAGCDPIMITRSAMNCSLPDAAPAETLHEKVQTAGTHRACSPEETWDKVCKTASMVGITRISDITGLDDVGIPVALAFRPYSRTLAVSCGKGITRLLAKISAGMEAIELWHAEHSLIHVIHARAEELQLDYPVEQLARPPRSAWTPQLAVNWMEGTHVVCGRKTLVPEDCVTLSSVLDDARWEVPTLLRTSNGLASGNTLTEAALHALLELVERDALSDYHATGQADMVALPCGIKEADRLFELFRAARNDVQLWRLPSRTDIPCFHAKVRSPMLPLTFTGAGSHTSVAIAVCRALTEAAQNRLGVIAGSRDDISSRLYEWEADIDRGSSFPSIPGRTVANPRGAPLAMAGDLASASLDHDLREVAIRVWRVTGVHPILVDLTRSDIQVPVARMVAPGLRFDTRTAFGRTATGAMSA